MKLFASVRFGVALAASERAVVTRTLRSAGAAATSWNAAADRTYGLLELAVPETPERVRAAYPEADLHVPPLVVLRVIPDRARHLPALAEALGGAGRPLGVVASATETNAVVVEVDVRTTPLATIVMLVDVEVGARGRRIEPILPLDDETLAAFAGSVLGEPSLDAARLIETHLEPLLERERT